MKLLSLVAVATAFEVRLKTSDLIDFLNLPEPRYTLEMFESEFLIRQIKDKSYIEAFHPIRSQILVELLTDLDIDTWIEKARDVLPLLLDEDLEAFILHAFIDRRENYENFLKLIFNFQPDTWTGIGGILRALLWAGVREYIEFNSSTIQEAYDKFGYASFLIFDLDLTDQINEPIFDIFWDKFSPENQRTIIEIRKKQPPKSEAFQLASNWLKSRTKRPSAPELYNDWTNMAELLYWIYHLDVAHNIESWIMDSQLDYAASDISIPILADLSYALHVCNKNRHKKWISSNRKLIEKRFAKKYKILALEHLKAENTLKIHFFMKDDIENKRSQENNDFLHKETMDRIKTLRCLFPEYENYASQGYCFKLGSIKLLFDSTQKNIARKDLKIDWAVRINSIAFNSSTKLFRPDIWIDYVNEIVNIRTNIVERVRELGKAVETYFVKNKPLNLFKEHVDTKSWDDCKSLLSNVPKFPKTALDQWGFMSEDYDGGLMKNERHSQKEFTPNSIVFLKYKRYLSLSHDYYNSFQNFFEQALHVICTNSYSGKIHPKKQKKKLLHKNLHKTDIRTDFDHLSTLNFFNCLKIIKPYQKNFRKLFSNYFDSKKLFELERAERETIKQTWQMWYFFAYKPYIKMSKPLNNVNTRVLSEKQKFDRRINNALTIMNSENIKTERLKIDFRWNKSNAMWIQLNIQDPILLHEAFQKLVSNLQEAFGEQNFKSLSSYIIEESYEYVIVIPLIRGKMINQNVWSINTLVSLYGQTTLENISLYYMEQISLNLLTKLGFEIWNIEDIHHANKLLEYFFKSWLHASQVLELNELPESDSITYFKDIESVHCKISSNQMSTCIQQFIDTKNILIDRFNEYLELENQQRSAVVEAFNILKDIHEHILPFEDGKSEISFNLEELGDYARVLENNIINIEMIRLLWITDILDNMDLS